MNLKGFLPSYLIRAALAASAVVATLGLGAFINGLAEHYSNDRAQLVLERTVVARFD